MGAVIEVDVVIVGGGVAGLWTLGRFRSAGRSAVLVERSTVGGRQTCHSHVYIHRGHLYRNVREARLVDQLKVSAHQWDTWLATAEPPDPAMPVAYETATWGFRSGFDANRQAVLWEHLALPSAPTIAPPALLERGEIVAVRNVPARCLYGRWLVEQLVQPHRESVIRAHVSAIGRSEGRAGPVTLGGAAGVTVHAEAIVLAAGSGNQGLIDMIGSEFGPRQRERTAHMLVVRGHQDDLPPLTGVFDLDGLFIVSRLPPGSGDIVWLVSDHRQDLAGPWVRNAVASLRRLAPGVFAGQQVDKLTWGIYKAPKSEAVADDFGHVHPLAVDTLGLENLWAVWPTKLTLAPLASQLLVDAVLPTLRRQPLPQPTEAAELGGHVSCSREWWEDVRLRPLHDVLRQPELQY